MTVQFIRLRLFGRQDKVYTIRLPKFPHPVHLRGGKSTDLWVVYELLVMGEYSAVASLPSAKVIIDGGANIGMMSLCFLNEYPDSRVIAVEPAPENFKLCEKNLAPYGPRVTLIQGAIWKTHELLALDLAGEEWSNRVESAAGTQRGSVRAFTIPDLLTQAGAPIDLLKLDIEGSEKEVFSFGAEQWLPSINNLVVELHGKECEEGFFRALEPYDYDMVRRDTVVACRNLRLRGERTGSRA